MFNYIVSIGACFLYRLIGNSKTTIGMSIKRTYITLLFLLMGVCAHAQDGCTDVKQDTSVWSRKLHVKTNVLGLGMAIANIGAEVDVTKHLSFALPAYYSAWNYFKSTIKFRTIAVQPEFRYWFSTNNDGFFTGVHFGYAQYNVAADGQYRYQDHDTDSPAVGGGLSMGYRLPISKNTRWKIEISLGAGVYSAYYDKFYNTLNVDDGFMIGSVKRVYWGLDQAAVSFSYMFDLKRKRGEL